MIIEHGQYLTGTFEMVSGSVMAMCDGRAICQVYELQGSQNANVYTCCTHTPHHTHKPTHTHNEPKYNLLLKKKRFTS